jgi:hypothetical protein
VWSPWLKHLNEVLADLFPTVDESRMIVARAGMRDGRIAFNSAAIVNWNAILRQAVLQSPDSMSDRPKVARDILAVALQSFPDDERLRALC